jgi:hypothetical protein
VINERVVFPLVFGCELMKLLSNGEQLLSSSHRWVVVTDAIMALRCDASPCCVQLCQLAQ